MLTFCFQLLALFFVALSSAGESQSPIPCSLCQIATTFVEQWIAQNATEQQIENGLDYICARLGPFGSQCDDFVSQYLPPLIAWIQNNENPQDFCIQVGICESPKKLKADAVPQKQDSKRLRLKNLQKSSTKVGNSTTCEMCDVVVTYVEQLIAQNSTLNEINTAVEDLCAALPGSFAPVCDSFVETYLSSLIVWILSEEDPATFCATVGLC